MLHTRNAATIYGENIFLLKYLYPKHLSCFMNERKSIYMKAQICFDAVLHFVDRSYHREMQYL